MRRFLAAVLFGTFMAAAPTAALAQSAQAQAIVSEWYSRFLHRPIDGAAGWEQALDQGQNPDKLLSGILGSNEYYLRAGGTDPGFVQTLFVDVNGRQPTQPEYALWLNQLIQLESSVPAYEVRDDVAYAMLLRYPQNWIAVAPTYVAPTVITRPVVVPRVIVRPGVDYDRRFHDHDEHFEYHRPPVAPIRRDIDHHDDRGRHDDHRDDHDRKR